MQEVWQYLKCKFTTLVVEKSASADLFVVFLSAADLCGVTPGLFLQLGFPPFNLKGKGSPRCGQQEVLEEQREENMGPGYLPGDPVAAFPNSATTGFPYPQAASSVFIPTPPSILPFTNQQFFHSPRRTSSSSLPGRLNRALSLGTIPSLARTDSGYLFSGSRPPSQTSHSKESPVSEYFSLLSGSCVPSPVPSPAPSVAGSVTSSSGSLRYRRPLISPARLNLKGQRLLLFPSQGQAHHHGEDHVHSETSVFASDVPTFPKRRLGDRGMHDMRAVVEAGSVCSGHSVKKRDSSSHSSSCVVDTTTKGEELTSWRGRFGNSAVRGLLAVSLTVNAIFTSAYLYQSFR
ncbi:UNVERIFIED_CONTAM: hypothetical protein K2H54_006163 [Gekko kuhli]